MHAQTEQYDTSARQLMMSAARSIAADKRDGGVRVPMIAETGSGVHATRCWCWKWDMLKQFA